MTISSHHPLPVPVLSALQYLMSHEMEINGPDAEPNELTDAITMLATFVAHVTATDPDDLFDMINAEAGEATIVEAHDYHHEPEQVQ